MTGTDDLTGSITKNLESSGLQQRVSKENGKEQRVQRRERERERESTDLCYYYFYKWLTYPSSDEMRFEPQSAQKGALKVLCYLRLRV